jgi:hypothetical protein
MSKQADALAAIIKAEAKEASKSRHPSRRRTTTHPKKEKTSVAPTVPADLATLVGKRVMIWLSESVVLGCSCTMTIEKIEKGKLFLSNGDKVTPAAIYKVVNLDA